MCIVIAKSLLLCSAAFIRITPSMQRDNREGSQVPLFYWSVKKNFLKSVNKGWPKQQKKNKTKQKNPNKPNDQTVSNIFQMY